MRALKKLVLMLCTAALAAYSAHAGGPVVLMGIDAEDGGPGGHGPISVYESVVNGILSQVSNGGAGILAIGAGKADFGFGPTAFWSQIALDTGIPVTQINGAANITAQSFAGFAMIAVVSDENNTFAGLTQAENDALAARAADVAAFVNTGGGLLGFSSDFLGGAGPYGYLGGIGGFTVTTQQGYSDITATAEGTALGISDALDICCWHDYYDTFPAFLSVLATDASNGRTAAVGGAQVIVTPPCPEPITIDVYAGFTQAGGGAPFSDLVGSLTATGVSFATDTGYNWHPFGLFEFGAVIKGYLDVASDDTYTFTLDSDDGSLLFIDGVQVVDNGDPHGPEISSGAATLTAGRHCFEIQFFECCGGPSGVDLILPDGVSYGCPPTCEITCPDNITVPNEAGACEAVVTYEATTAGDCSGVTVVCSPASGSLFPVGTTEVTCTATDACGNVIDQCTFNVTVEDREAPAVACRPTTNPAGSNVPNAGKDQGSNPNSGQNPDGFYELLAIDNCGAAGVQIYVKDSAEGPCDGAFSAGPYAPGTKVKLTQSPGQQSVKPMAGDIAAHINTMGEPVIVAFDAAGNSSVCATCFVPPPPK